MEQNPQVEDQNAPVDDQMATIAATPTSEEQAQPASLPQPGEITTVRPEVVEVVLNSRGQVSPEFQASLGQGDLRQPISLSRGEMPSFAKSDPYSQYKLGEAGGELAKGLDPRVPENAQPIYERYFGVLDPQNTQAKEQIDNALISATHVITNIQDNDPAYQFFGGRRTFKMPQSLITGVKADGSSYTREELIAQRARFVRLVGGTSLFAPTSYDQAGNGKGGREIELPVLQELRAFKGKPGTVAYDVTRTTPEMLSETVLEVEATGEPTPLYGSMPFMLDDDQKIAKFYKYLDRRGHLDPYMKRDLLFAQATGQLDAARQEGRALDPFRTLANIAFSALQLIDNDSKDEYSTTGADGKKRISSDKFPLAVDQLAATSGYPVEVIESALLFSPDLLDYTKQVGPEALVGLGVSTAIRMGVAEVGRFGVKRWLKKNSDEFGGAETLEQAALNSKLGIGQILDKYHADELSTRWFQNWRRSKNIADLEISTVARTWQPDFRRKVFEERWNGAQARLKKAQESLSAIEARQSRGKGISQSALTAAKKRVANAEKALVKIRTEMAVPQYFQDVAKEGVFSVAGAAVLGQTAQDMGVTDPTALAFVEMGGAITGSVAPRAIGLAAGAPVLIPGYLAMGLFNILTGKQIGKGKARKEAEQLTAFLGELSPEQAELLQGSAERVIAIQDRLRETGLLTEADLEVTSAELLNIPLLRMYSDRITENVYSAAEISNLDERMVELSNNLVKEQNSLNNLAKALDKLQALEGDQFDPELKAFYVDLKKLHAGLEADFKMRQNSFQLELEQQNAEKLLYLTGRKVNVGPDGRYEVPDFTGHFDAYEKAFINQMEIDGKSADEINDAIIALQQERLDTLIEYGRAARANPLDQEYDESIHMAAIIDTRRRLTESRVDKRYRDWETMADPDTFMDGQVILQDLMTRGNIDLDDEALKQIGVERTKWADVAPGVRYMYAGDTIGASSTARLSQIFGRGSELYLSEMQARFARGGMEDTFDKLMTAAGADEISDPFIKWRAVKGFLNNADPNELAEINANFTMDAARAYGQAMSLPISPVEMRMMSSALGKREFGALKGRTPAGGLEPGRTRSNIFALAESEEYGFKKDFFNKEGSRAPVGEEMMSELREINQYYVDEWVDRYVMDPDLKGLIYPQGQKLQKGKQNIRYRAGEGPANQLSILLNKVTKLDDTASHAAVLDALKPIIQGTGGRKVIDSKGVEHYVLDADSIETQALRNVLAVRARRIIRQSEGAQNLMLAADADNIPQETLDYLEAVVKDPSLFGISKEDQKILDALTSLKTYQFDADGNIIPGSQQFLLNGDDAVEMISFNTVRKISKQADTMATKYEGEMQGIVKTFATRAEEKFTYENAYRRSALNITERLMGAGGTAEDIQTQLYRLSLDSADGPEVLAAMKEGHINALVREAQDAGVSGTALDGVRKNAELGFDQYVKDNLAKYINKQVIEIGQGTTADGARDIRINLDKLDEILGNPEGSMTQIQRADALKEIIGTEHYDDIKAIADFIALKTATYDNAKFSGVARSYSVESYISRLYSISRDVVSPRYVLTEVAVQASRVSKQEEFARLISDPDIARHVAQIIREGDMVSERSARRYFEATANWYARTAQSALRGEEDVPREEDSPFNQRVQPAARPGGPQLQTLGQ